MIHAESPNQTQWNLQMKWLRIPHGLLKFETNDETRVSFCKHCNLKCNCCCFMLIPMIWLCGFIFWGLVSDGVGVFWGLSDGACVFWGLSDDAGVFWGLSDDACVFWGLSDDAGVLWGLSDGAHVWVMMALKHLQKCTVHCNSSKKFRNVLYYAKCYNYKH